jgi:ubiquinone/menaquinone biosynthesis C-methylase UbiE
MAYRTTLTRLNPCDPQIVAQLLEPRVQRGARVIDIGCGRGTTLAWLSKHTEYTLFGAEPDAELNAEARENCPAAVFACAGAEDLPFWDWTFDAALMECVFSLLKDPICAVNELNRVIKPQGIFVLTDLYTRSRDDLYVGQSAALPRYIYTRPTMETFFEKGGFALDSFYDQTTDLGSRLAQMFMDGIVRNCVDDETVKLLRQLKAGYGIWIWRKA